MDTVLGLFGIAVGMLVVAQWAGNFLTHKIPELETEPWAIRFHIAAELLMAATLVYAGSLVLLRQAAGQWLLLVGFGMTIYSVVNSSGYFAQRRQIPPLAIFAMLLVLLLLATAALFSLQPIQE